MAKHHADLIMCRKQPGVGKCIKLWIYIRSFSSLVTFFSLVTFYTLSHAAIGRLCEKRELNHLLYTV